VLAASLHTREAFLFSAEDWQTEMHAAKHIAVTIMLAGVAAFSPACIPARASRQQSPPPHEVTDDTGRHMQIPAQVHRIVSLAPNLTEIVYALGAGDRLAGDTNYCDTPPEAKLKPHVGDVQNPSLEAIVALHPDLVLATTSINVPQTADSLLKLGIPVYTSDPHTVRDTLASIAKIGELIGAKSQGESVVAQLQSRLDALHTRLSDRPMSHVLFLVWLSPPQSIGLHTFIADAIRYAGAESILVTDQSWPKPTFEEIVRIQPDYVVVTTDHEGSSADLADLRSRTDWKQLSAIRLGRIAVISDHIDEPGPSLVNAIEDLARQLHPEAFVTAPCAAGVPCAH
jgi:iron complex transport system substrate-binding protein